MSASFDFITTAFGSGSSLFTGGGTEVSFPPEAEQNIAPGDRHTNPGDNDGWEQ
ncbi:MAG: vacuolating cytotoxin domain-containing protein [Deltaproteobacteria bacterium]|nr:vacuolating cytotoxin domain-containing protein [Deltaproteobacteria bacterium]MBN2672827.1 vacuolating cytotoxin domain-containing protein [Deltaproteobacteria bacterium]